jgi:8-oxo-dGTP pyrophosphatase MutT (NUDIX family)
VYFNFREILEQYFPTDPEEINCKKRMLDFLANHPNCFERSFQLGHFTASCWLMNAVGDKALLMHHKKLDRWLQLGGHADGNSNLLDVAIREAQEESGIEKIVAVSPTIFDIDIHPIPSNAKEPEHEHFDVRFLLQTQESDDFKKNDESHALMWIGKNLALLPTQNPSILRMFRKWYAIL